MTEPTFTAATEDTYGSLAQYLRAADRRGTWVLKRFLAAMLDQLGLVRDTYERIDYLSPDEFGADTRALTLYHNLVLNPSYEYAAPDPEHPLPLDGNPPFAYTDDAGAAPYVPVTETLDGGHALLPEVAVNSTAGRTSAHVSRRDNGLWAWEFLAIDPGPFGGMIAPNRIPVTASAVTVSADVYAFPGRTIRFAFDAFDANGDSLGVALGDVPYVGPGYQRLTAILTLPLGTVGGDLYAYAQEGAGGGEVFLIDCVQAVAGIADVSYRPYEGVLTGETSELVTPETADDAWLPWLAQLVGVQRLNPSLTREAKVDAIRYASAGWRGGTKSAVAAAAKSVLTGTQYVKVFDHSTEAGIGTGGEWDVLLITRATETPDVDAVLKAVVDQRAKPAGVLLHHLAYNATWADIQAAYPTWADWHAAGTWARIEEAGL